MQKDLQLKQQLYDYCSEYLKTRLDNINSGIRTARESANDDSKSSAGDKHETGRAMAQLEQEKLSHQLSETIKLQNTLESIDPNKINMLISLGSIVITNNGNYFISISAGKQIIQDQTYFMVSTLSPIGQELIRLGSKKEFSFNGQNYSIKKVL